MIRIACVGEALVDLLAEPEISDIGTSEYFRRAAGGSVSNVSIGIARLGGSVAFVGTVGRDRFGRFLLRTLAHENVNVDAVRTVDAATPVVFIARGPRGERDFYPIQLPGADALLRADDLDRALLERAQAIHFGGVVLAKEPGRSACMRAAEIGRDTGLVTFDPNVRKQIFPDKAEMRRVILAACAASQLVKCSAQDLRALGFDDANPTQLLGKTTSAVIVTHGADGCAWATRDGKSGEARAPRIAAVDTTGAGDAFMAALLWRLVYHHQSKRGSEELADAVDWAVVAGAMACTKEGAIASLPRADELEAEVGERARSER